MRVFLQEGEGERSAKRSRPEQEAPVVDGAPASSEAIPQNNDVQNTDAGKAEVIE